MHPLVPRFWRFLARRIDSTLLIALLLLMLTGLLVLFSAANGNFARVNSQLGNMAVALTVMWVVANIPPQYLMRLALPLFIAGCLLLVAAAVLLRLRGRFSLSRLDGPRPSPAVADRSS